MKVMDKTKFQLNTSKSMPATQKKQLTWGVNIIITSLAYLAPLTEFARGV